MLAQRKPDEKFLLTQKLVARSQRQNSLIRCGAFESEVQHQTETQFRQNVSVLQSVQIRLLGRECSACLHARDESKRPRPATICFKLVQPQLLVIGKTTFVAATYESGSGRNLLRNFYKVN